MICPHPDEWSDLADPSLRAPLEHHLDACDDCRKLVAALAMTITPCADDQEPVVPELASSGTRIGRYIVEGPLGTGGMGVVLAARDPALDRTVALKLVRVIDRSPDAVARARARLVHEARAMAQLAHPNVVAVHEIVSTEDVLFIAMERVDGWDLATWLADAPRSAAERLSALLDAARGVVAAHAAGFVHRDLKPANILIGRDGRARLADLGLATVSDTDGGPELVGTPGYIAPEVLGGAPVDARADQYAFAVTAGWTLFGERPTADDLARRRDRIARALARALADDPAARYPSMQALVDALAAAARPRWPRFAIGVTALALGALAMGWWHAAQRTAITCETVPSTASTWSVPRRSALLASLIARDHSPGRQRASQVVDLVDRRVSSWDAALRDVCTARTNDAIAADAADARITCLEDLTRELDALLDVLARGTAVSRALPAVAHLPQPELCRSPSSLASSHDPAHAIARAELHLVSALRATGKYADAKARMHLLASHAPKDDPRLTAEIAYRLGELEMRTGHGDAALPLIHEAIATAERAHDDATRLRAMIVLVSVLEDQGREKDAAALAPLLSAAASREVLGDAQISMLDNTLGNLASLTGDYAEAERLHRIELAATQREYGGAPSPETAGAMDAVATALHDQGKRDEARELLERAAAMFEQTVGPLHPDLAFPLQELAAIATERSEFERAVGLFERVIAIRSAALGRDHPYLSEPIGMLGDVEHRRGNDDRALELHRRALSLAEGGFGSKHPLAAVAQGHIAEILLARGQRDEARSLAERAVAIWDESGASLPPAFDARFLLAQLSWDRDRKRARVLAEAARAGYAALAPPYNAFARPIEAWLASHPLR